jgi:hypothetical protein
MLAHLPGHGCGGVELEETGFRELLIVERVVLRLRNGWALDFLIQVEAELIQIESLILLLSILYLHKLYIILYNE